MPDEDIKLYCIIGKSVNGSDYYIAGGNDGQVYKSLEDASAAALKFKNNYRQNDYMIAVTSFKVVTVSQPEFKVEPM